MVRRMVWFLSLAVLLMGIKLPVSAESTGTIRVSLDYGVGPVERGAVTVYRVAAPMEGSYRLAESYGGGVIRQEDACSPELALWLSDRSDTDGVRQQLDESGGTVFSGLEKGLYLVVQTEAPSGWHCVSPFLVPVPMDGEWEILACPKMSVLLTQSPKTGQYPTPLIGAMGLVLSGTGLYFCIEKRRKK